MLRFGIVDARLRSFVVNDRGARLHRCLRIENGGKDLVVDDQPVAARLGRGFAIGHHGGDALTDKTHNPVQYRGVVGIDALVLVPGGRVKLCRRVFISQDRAHARNRQCAVLADRFDPRMRMRRAQQLEMQKPGRCDVHRVAGGAADNGAPGRRGNTAAACVTGFGVFGLAHPANGIFDCAVAGATTNVAF